MILDGRTLAEEILAEVRQSLGGTSVTIRAIVVAPTPATKSYLGIKQRAAEKAGMRLVTVELPEDATTDEVVQAIHASSADAVIVQLPLPSHVDTDAVLAAIPLEQDADVLSPAARAAGMPTPPVAGAVEEILRRAGISVPGKQAVVVGKGYLVGIPVAARLEQMGATVACYDKDTFTLDVLGDADIIVSGAGVPHLITPEMIQPGAAIIDAGTSEQDGAIVGDIDPACADVTGLLTPVPGGVGPVAVAVLMRNVATLKSLQNAVH